MKNKIAFPYFAAGDISKILNRFKRILSGDGLLTMGDNVRELEKSFASYIGTRHAIATNSGTSALEIALRAIGVKDGDEIIVPAQTFIATGSSVIFSGGRPIFCETNENFLLDFEDMEKKISPRTKAVIIVHFAGLIQPDIFDIKRYLKKKGIYLIEDAAHAPGAKIRETFAGNIGDIGCFSFYATKIMTTGEGGMVTVNDARLYDICSSLRNRGLDIKSHNEIFSNVGSNRRFTEFQAILGIYQLKRLENAIKHRNNIANIYRNTMKDLEERRIVSFQEYPSHIRHAYWRFIVVLKNSRISREQLKRKMDKLGIKVDWPYSPLLHLQPAFKKLYGIKKGFLPKTESLAKRHFCLPMHSMIKESDARYIANKITETVQ